MGDFPSSPRRQLFAAWQAAAAALGEWREQVSEATVEAAEKLDPAAGGPPPALRAGAAPRGAAAAVTGNWGACQCLCATAHPLDKGVCDGGAIMNRRVDGADVPLCAPCAVAQGFAEMPH